MKEKESFWKVTTAGGDRFLGIYTGNIVDIAFALAEKSIRGLIFTHIYAKHIKEFKPTHNKVSVCITDSDYKRAKELIQEEDRNIIIADEFNYQVDDCIGRNYINMRVPSKEEAEAEKARKILEENGIDVDTVKDYL
jgi:hypothetical protein